MANEIKEVEAGARINHPVFRDVYNTTFDKDVIVDFEILEGGTLSGRCKTEKYDWFPVFYHCKKHCYSEDTATLEANNSLRGGVLALEVGMEVKVLMEEGTPKYILGPFEQYNPPRMCEDIFRMFYSRVAGGDISYYFVGSEGIELVDGVDYYGDTPVCERQEIILSEWIVPFEDEPDNYWYESDRFVKVGPVFYVFWFGGSYHSNSSGGGLNGAWVGMWTQEKEDELVARWAGVDSQDWYDYERTITYPELTDASTKFHSLFQPLMHCGSFGAGSYLGLDWRTLVLHGQGEAI